MIPDNVRQIMSELNSAGYQAFVVGGAIRDKMLGKRSSDWDIATDAYPDETHRIFEERAQSTDRSRDHGTVFVDGIDITTFRYDHDEDGFNAMVEWADSIFSDLTRRDFTFNAMAMNLDGIVIDPFDGRHDLQQKVVRAVGDPDKRIVESYVRMLRACRFAALDREMNLEPHLHQAIERNRRLIQEVPAELIQRELMKMMAYPHPENGLNAMQSTGLLDIVLPEVAATFGCNQENCHLHTFDVFQHSLITLSAIPSDKPTLRFAALFHDVGKPHCKSISDSGAVHFYDHEVVGAEIAKQAMRRLRFSNGEIEYVVTLIREHMVTLASERSIRRLLCRLGEVSIEDLLALRTADRFACDGLEKVDHDVVQARQWIARIHEENHALAITDLRINGDDLVELGYTPGPLFRRVLTSLLEEVLDNPELNTQEYLLERAMRIA